MRKRYVYRVIGYFEKPYKWSEDGILRWTSVRHVQSTTAVDKRVAYLRHNYTDKPHKITVERSSPVFFPLDFDGAPHEPPDVVTHVYPEHIASPYQEPVPQTTVISGTITAQSVTVTKIANPWKTVNWNTSPF